MQKTKINRFFLLEVICVVLLGLIIHFSPILPAHNIFSSVLPLDEVEIQSLSVCVGTEQESCSAITDSATCGNSYILHAEHYFGCVWDEKNKKDKCKKDKKCEPEVITLEICDNSQDDDEDGNIDCADSDCEEQTCAEKAVCSEGVCTPLCGNGVIDVEEQCDGEELDGSSCEAQSYLGGELSCNENCQFDTSSCAN